MHKGGAKIVVAVDTAASMRGVMVIMRVIVGMVVIVSVPMVMVMVVVQQERTKQVDT